MKEEPNDALCCSVYYMSELQDSVLHGLLQLSVFIVLLSILVLLSKVSCIFVWAVLIIALLAMLFCRMPHLWIVVAAAFVVSFYVGCQAGCHWLTLTTKFSFP